MPDEAREIRSPFVMSNPQAGDGRIDGDWSIAPSPASAPERVQPDPKDSFAQARASILKSPIPDVPRPEGIVLPSFVIPGDKYPEPDMHQTVPMQQELPFLPVVSPPKQTTPPVELNPSMELGKLLPPPIVPPTITPGAVKASTKPKVVKNGTQVS